MKKDYQLKNKLREQRQLRLKLKPLLIGLWILCFLSFFYTAFTIRDVIIDYKIPFLLAAFCGLIGILFTKSRDNYFFAFLGYGSLITGIPLFVNSAFADKQIVEMKVMINDKHHQAGRHGPSVDIKYNDLEKEINVDDEKEMDSSSYIILKLNKGALGYYIIKDKELVKN